MYLLGIFQFEPPGISFVPTQHSQIAVLDFFNEIQDKRSCRDVVIIILVHADFRISVLFVFWLNETEKLDIAWVAICGSTFFIKQGSVHQLKHPTGPQVTNPNYDPTDLTKRNEPKEIDKPSDKITRAEEMILKEHVSHYVKSTYKLEADLQWAYAILKGQCPDELIVKLQWASESGPWRH